MSKLYMSTACPDTENTFGIHVAESSDILFCRKCGERIENGELFGVWNNDEDVMRRVWHVRCFDDPSEGLVAATHHQLGQRALRLHKMLGRDGKDEKS